MIDVVGARYRTHGMTGSGEYNIWAHIVSRCENVNNHAYADYGGRGIRVCARWRCSFENFLADMGPRPSATHSIDRIDNDGHYEPGNCRWATALVQARNSRRNIFLTHNGVTRCVSEWAGVVGIGRRTLEERVRRGWSVQRVLEEPVQYQKQVVAR